MFIVDKGNKIKDMEYKDIKIKVQKNNSKSLEQNDKLDCKNIVSSQ